VDQSEQLGCQRPHLPRYTHHIPWSTRRSRVPTFLPPHLPRWSRAAHRVACLAGRPRFLGRPGGSAVRGCFKDALLVMVEAQAQHLAAFPMKMSTVSKPKTEIRTSRPDENRYYSNRLVRTATAGPNSRSQPCYLSRRATLYTSQGG
jgi:hypothetical protein